MSFQLQKGFIGNKDRFVAVRVLEEEIGRDEYIYIAETHNQHIKGQVVNNVEDITKDEFGHVKPIIKYNCLDDFLDSGDLDGYVDMLLEEKELELEAEDLSKEEHRKYVQEVLEDEYTYETIKILTDSIFEESGKNSLLKLFENGKVYVAANKDCDTIISNDKISVILKIADNDLKSQNIFTFKEAEEKIKKENNEEITIFLNDYTSNKDEYIQEWEQLEELIDFLTENKNLYFRDDFFTDSPYSTFLMSGSQKENNEQKQKFIYALIEAIKDKYSKEYNHSKYEIIDKINITDEEIQEMLNELEEIYNERFIDYTGGLKQGIIIDFPKKAIFDISEFDEELSQKVEEKFILEIPELYSADELKERLLEYKKVGFLGSNSTLYNAFIAYENYKSSFEYNAK